MYNVIKGMNDSRRRRLMEGTLTLEESMVQRYGPLLSIHQLASVLDRSPEGLRITLRSSGGWVKQINSTRLRLGRRVYFRTSEIATLLGAK
jgi:hypothetical protein